MTSIFDPRCSIPYFLQTDQSIVERCGSVGGVVTVIVLICILLIMSAGFYVKYKSETGKIVPFDETRRNRIRRMFLIKIIIILFIGILSVIFIPKLSAFFSLNSWKSSQYQIQQYMNSGLTREQAIAKMQSLYQSQMEVDAIYGAAGELSKNNF